ncbi:hypothetical protein VTL71DRAFT_14179 [Oculimacula yallundae]|uniref:Uncharacterized protein n=1 Tax=Oculimacula yallundae TaxID=86028 RepID=A0ABR4CHR4_9HELO
MGHSLKFTPLRELPSSLPKVLCLLLPRLPTTLLNGVLHEPCVFPHEFNYSHIIYLCFALNAILQKLGQVQLGIRLRGL